MAFGYQWGATTSNTAHQAAQNRAAIVAQKRFDAEQLRGQTAVASLTTERQAFDQTYTELQEKFHELRRRTPLLARPGPVDVVRNVRSVAGAGDPNPAHQDPVNASPVDSVPVLSAGALWMWNSALAGSDQPAGACGSADTSEAACAADSGATLDDAWRNHAINAQRCAEDRLNHQRLIDFIKQQPQQERAP